MTVPHPPESDRLIAGVLIAGAFLIVFANVPSTLFDLERHAVPKELVLHATALACLLILLRRVRALRAGVVTILLLAFLAWSTLSALFATNHWLSFRALGITLSGVIVYLAARAAAPAARTIVSGLALASVAAALTGLAQVYGLESVWLSSDRVPGGTFGNRNFLAHLLVIAAPLSIGALLRNGASDGARNGSPMARRLLAAAGLAIIVAAVILTRSRAAWLAAGVSSAALIGLLLAQPALRHGSKPRALLVSAAVALGLSAAVMLPNRLEWRSDSPFAETLTRITDYRTGSGRARMVQYSHSLKLVAQDPVLGVGPGNWMVHYPRVTEPGDPSFAAVEMIPTNPWPSSDWIALITERGVVGALLLLLALAAAATTVVRRISTDQPPEPAAVFGSQGVDAAILIGVLTAALASGAFDAVLLLPAPTYFVFATLGALAPATRPVMDWTPGARTNVMVRLAVVLAALTLVFSALGQFWAVQLAGDGRDRAALERAASLDPGSHRIRLLLARRGSCTERMPDALAAARMLPNHLEPRRTLDACRE